MGSKPPIVSQRYLRKADDIEAAMTGARWSPIAPGTSALTGSP